MDFYQSEVSSVVELLKDIKIIPVLAIEKVEDGIRVCELLNKCGLKAPLHKNLFCSQVFYGFQLG